MLFIRSRHILYHKIHVVTLKSMKHIIDLRFGGGDSKESLFEVMCLQYSSAHVLVRPGGRLSMPRLSRRLKLFQNTAHVRLYRNLEPAQEQLSLRYRVI